MESPSAPTHRGLGPRQGLLLAASLLTLWSLPTTAQLTIESVPPNAVEGKDVLLCVHNLPGNLGSYTWYTGGKVDYSHQIVSYVIDTQTTTRGPESSGRETIYPNGSLLFQKVSLKDTGYYTLLATDKDYESMQVTGQLRVYPSNATVTEHKDAVVLTCLTNDRGISIRWLFKNQSLLITDRMKLSQDNSTLTIDPLRRKDAGGYQCEVFNPVSSSKSDLFRLDMDESLEEPSIRASNATVTEHKDAVVLTCLTNNKGISIRWLFNNQNLLLMDRMMLSQDKSTLTIDPVRREDAGGYQCEVFNPVSSSISEPLRLDVQSEQNYKGYSVGTIIGSVIGVLVVVALGASLG
uniref:Ig-like domain-containing protein n=1 Tax=Myotis lucifugus TaxID=59463 RepID=L7N131_MYOLU